MTIIVDAMGGDKAPVEIIKGAAMAKKKFTTDIVLCGIENVIINSAKENDIDISQMEILPAPSIMTTEENPMFILKEKNDSSLALGLKALTSGKGNAFVSAGSTGALTVGGTFHVKRIKGIKRAAIGAVMPSDSSPFIMVDAGANIECKPEFLLQFAIMGSIYMNKILGVPSPRVGLANIGAEKTKGTSLYLETYEMLEKSHLNFIGNTEVRDIPYGNADVVVADGFTGNVILKMYEGTAKFFSSNIKAVLTDNPLSLFGGLFVKKGFDALKRKMDYKELGGAPLLGLKKPVIKAHGSSDSRAIMNAIGQAIACVDNKVTEAIENNILSFSEQ